MRGIRRSAIRWILIPLGMLFFCTLDVTIDGKRDGQWFDPIVGVQKQHLADVKQE